MAPISRASPKSPIAVPRVALWLAAEAALAPREALNCLKPVDELSLVEGGGEAVAAVAAPDSVAPAEGTLMSGDELNPDKLDVPVPDVPVPLELLLL